MTKKMQTEIKAFVASVFLGATEGRELMCWKTAEETINEWKNEGVELPKGLTPYYLSVYWNEMVEKEGEIA